MLSADIRQHYCQKNPPLPFTPLIQYVPTQTMVWTQRGTGVMIVSGAFICHPAVQNRLRVLQCEEARAATWTHQKKFNPL